MDATHMVCALVSASHRTCLRLNGTALYQGALLAANRADIAPAPAENVRECQTKDNVLSYLTESAKVITKGISQIPAATLQSLAKSYSRLVSTEILSGDEFDGLIQARRQLLREVERKLNERVSKCETAIKKKP